MRSQKKLKLFIFFGIWAILPSCVPATRIVEFEVLEPAGKAFPKGVEQLLIMNRLPPSYHFLDSVSRSALNRDQLVILDTLIRNSIFEGLFSVLRASPVNSFNWPIWNADRQSKLFTEGEMKLTKKEVLNLCEENHTDAIVSLEQCYVDIDFDGYIYPVTIPVTKSYRVVFVSRWLFYHPNFPKPYHEFGITDTLYYETKEKSPKYSKMISGISYRSGVKAGAMVSPVWIGKQRNIFSGGNNSLIKAAWFTGEEDWEEALDLWLEVSASGSRKSAAKSFHNIAVYFELEDNLDSAAFYINKALALYTLDETLNYQLVIHTRKFNKQMILEQINQRE